MIVDLTVEWSAGKSRDGRSRKYQEDDASIFADKLALAKFRLRSQSLKNLRKYELEKQQLMLKRKKELDELETEHIRYVKYVNNYELRQGLDIQALLM